jgi:hypothetical protein
LKKPATAEIVSERKPTGKYDAIFCTEHRQIPVFVPELDHFQVQLFLKAIHNLSVAIGTGENNYTEFHGANIRKGIGQMALGIGRA